MFNLFKKIIDLIISWYSKSFPGPVGYPETQIPEDVDRDFKIKPFNYLDVSVADITAKYETGNRGVGFISNGMGGLDPGGISYGNYQLETKKGTMAAYLKSSYSGKYGPILSKYTINSTLFKNVWKQLAASEPIPFDYTQFIYLAKKIGGYEDAYEWAKANGWNVDNLAMCSAIYSTVNQSGGWKSGIFARAGIIPSDSLVTQINKLYDARAAYFNRIALDERVKQSIIKNRTVLERRDVLKLI